MNFLFFFSNIYAISLNLGWKSVRLYPMIPATIHVYRPLLKRPAYSRTLLVVSDIAQSPNDIFSFQFPIHFKRQLMMIFDLMAVSTVDWRIWSVYKRQIKIPFLFSALILAYLPSFDWELNEFLTRSIRITMLNESFLLFAFHLLLFNW